MTTKWQRFSVDIPKSFTPNERIAISKGIVDHIRERSKKHIPLGGPGGKQAFPQYTKKYAEEKGVSRGSVDLILDDKMLKAMQLLSQKKGKLLIGYKNGSDENAKADGNHRGTYGKSSPIAGKARPFVGITKKDLKVIVDKFKKKPEEEIKRIASEVVAGVQ